MIQFKPLGKRDIFGIVLPGTIVVFAATYALFGIHSILRLPIDNLLDQQFLLSAVLFVAAYLVGSVLRMYAADDVDKESSEVLKKEYEARVEASKISSFQECRAELSKGNDVDRVPDGFDDWLPRVEEFPYPAWQNRKWQAHNLREPLDFFRDRYGSSMWSKSGTSPKSFFNFCKLAVVNIDGALAEEINISEGLIRFFAGTVIALRISIWLLIASLVVQLALVGALTLASWLGGRLHIDWVSQGFHCALTPVLVLALLWIRRRIVRRYRYVRLLEVETVYHAFYLYSTRLADKTTNEGQEGP